MLHFKILVRFSEIWGKMKGMAQRFFLSVLARMRWTAPLFRQRPDMALYPIWATWLFGYASTRRSLLDGGMKFQTATK